MLELLPEAASQASSSDSEVLILETAPVQPAGQCSVRPERRLHQTLQTLHLPRLHLKTLCESYEQNAPNEWLPSVPSDRCCYYNIFVLCCPLITLVTFCVCVCVSLQMTHTIKLLRRSWRFPTRSRTPVWTRRTQRSRIKEDEEKTCTWHEGQAGG